MKNSRKAIPGTATSLLCGIIVAWLYFPFPPWLNTTQLFFFEFPPFSVSMLSGMATILVVGVILGAIARKYAAETESKLQKRIATAGMLLNAIILVLPVLNFISISIPRTITRVVDFKIGPGGYICVKEFEAITPWGQEVNFDKNTRVYEKIQNLDQRGEIASTDEIQPGQVVEIQYFDKATSIWGIKARSITILRGQYRPYNNANCGNSLP